MVVQNTSVSLNRIKGVILFFSLIALCFDAYAFIYVKTFPVTLSFLCIAGVLIIGVLEFIFFNKAINIRQMAIGLLLVLFIVVNVVFSENRDLSSALLYIFYISLFCVSGYEMSQDRFYNNLKIVMIVYTILSVYGIYQFIAYALDLPFKEFLIEGHMVAGFNRTNLVSIGGHVFQRAHSIYLEPSYLSQFAAFAILLALILYRKKFIKISSCIVIFAVNLVVSVLSVAGTGFLMLGVLMIYFCIDYVIKHGFNKKVLVGALVILCGFICVFCVDMDVTNYIRIRIYEIVDPKYSGGMRFSYPYLIMFDTWSNHIFGYTPGNEFIAIIDYFNKAGIPSTFSTMASGYAKIGVELGLPGLVLLFCLMFSVNHKEIYNKYIFVFVLCINIVGGNLLQNYFWIFIMLLNVNFNSESKIKRVELEKSGKGVCAHKTELVSE